MKRPMDVYWELRRERFNEKDAQRIAGIYKQMVESERDYRPWGIATVVCARCALSPEIWHERLTRIFGESRELSRA